MTHGDDKYFIIEIDIQIRNKLKILTSSSTS